MQEFDYHARREHEFVTRACFNKFELQFRLEDGTVKSFGYASDGENPAILRCDQLRCFDE